MTRLFPALLLGLGLLGLTSLFAQERELRLKVSGSYVFPSRIVNPSTGLSLTSNSFSVPQVALLWSTWQGDFHEIGLENLFFSHPQGQGSLRPLNHTFRLRSSYQYNLTTRDHWDHLKLYLGIGASVELFSDRRNLTGSPDFGRRYGGIVGLRLTPGLMYDFSDRFFGSFAVPTTWLPFRYSQNARTVNNGNVLFQRVSDFSWWPNQVPVEVGFGVRF
jgi:hypothetical protein